MMKKKRVLIPLPNKDFDPTEVAVSWKIVHDAGHDVIFATETGAVPSPDPIMISGEGLDPWGFLPVLKKLVLVGQLLRARKTARTALSQMQKNPSFLQPLAFSDLETADFDGLLVPGGHAPGMRQYLECEALQEFVGRFFTLDEQGCHKPVGAVCHGVLLLARSTLPGTGKSVLWGRKTTALTWVQEKAAQDLTRVSRFWDPLYYRTYWEGSTEPKGFWSVEHEVKRALEHDADFVDVPRDAPNHWHKTGNMARDSMTDERPAWVVRDGNYVSARWPGDVHRFAKTFVELLEA